MALEVFSSKLLIAVVSLLSTSVSCSEDVDWTKCGESQTCVLSPSGCNPSSNCDLAAAFLNVSSDYIGFRLRARSKIPRSYVAIAMSEDQNSTDNSTVVFCSPAPDDQIVRFGLKESGILRFPSHEEDKRLSIIKRITYLPEDKLIICDFDRVITPIPETPFADPLTIPKYAILSTGTITSKGLPAFPSLTYQTPEKVSFGVSVNSSQGDLKTEEKPKVVKTKEEASEKGKREFRGMMEQEYAVVPISEKEMKVYRGDSASVQPFEEKFDKGKREYGGGYARYPPRPSYRGRGGYEEFEGPGYEYAGDDYVPRGRPPVRYGPRPSYHRVAPEPDFEYEPPRQTPKKTAGRREEEEEDEKTKKSSKGSKDEKEKLSKKKKGADDESESDDEGDPDGAMGQNVCETAFMVILALALL